jgi:hypothetical protein
MQEPQNKQKSIENSAVTLKYLNEVSQISHYELVPRQTEPSELWEPVSIQVTEKTLKAAQLVVWKVYVFQFLVVKSEGFQKLHLRLSKSKVC